MLILRPAQMKALEHTVRQSFEDKLAVHLAGYLGEKGSHPGPEYIQDQIQRGLALCDDFGLERQCDIARYLEIVLGSIGGFTAKPLPKDAMNILYTYRMDPELKLKRLADWAEKGGK